MEPVHPHESCAFSDVVGDALGQRRLAATGRPADAEQAAPARGGVLPRAGERFLDRQHAFCRA